MQDEQKTEQRQQPGGGGEEPGRGAQESLACESLLGSLVSLSSLTQLGLMQTGSMSASYILGIDIGTTSVKVIIILDHLLFILLHLRVRI